MLRVLHHYLPIRKALLILGETVLLTLVVSAWMTAHLWKPSRAIEQALSREIPAMNVEDALVRCLISAFMLSVLAQLAIAFNELYDVRISGSRYDRAGRFVESAGSGLFLTLLAVVLVHVWSLKHVLDFPPLTLSQRVQGLVFALLSGFLVLYYWRALFHYLLRRSNFSERVLILGSGKAAHALAHEMRERPDAGYEIVGILPDASTNEQRTRGGSRRASDVTAAQPQYYPPRSSAVPRAKTGALRETAAVTAVEVDSDTKDLILTPLSLLGPDPDIEPGLHSGSAAALSGTSGNGASGHATPRSLYDLVRELEVDILVVAIEDRRDRLPTEQLLHCRLAGIPVREQEAVYEQITGKIAVEALRPSYLIFNEGFSRHPWNELSKRAVDVLLASLLLLLTWPLMIATAIAIRMDSDGPILFSQERVGRDGQLFTLLKFRSMRADAEKMTGPVWATQDDPRITRVGRFIRRTRLDELPQIFNVLAGHMSLVGPRPERQHFVDDLAAKIPYFRQRHIVKPGLTGWAQINYRYGSTFEDALQKLQYDLFYIKNQSLLFDLSILFNTVKIVILRKGT
jgi:lipopolysaccharide/colanic/teichoic acid biosynthesis glycosyltransferase